MIEEQSPVRFYFFLQIISYVTCKRGFSFRQLPLPQVFLTSFFAAQCCTPWAFLASPIYLICTATVAQWIRHRPPTVDSLQ